MTSIIPSEITFVFYSHSGKISVGECTFDTEKLESIEHMTDDLR